MRFVTVRFETGGPPLLTYTDPNDEYNVGDRVIAPIRQRQVEGVVEEINVSPPPFSCRPITGPASPSTLPPAA